MGAIGFQGYTHKEPSNYENYPEDSNLDVMATFPYDNVISFPFINKISFINIPVPAGTTNVYIKGLRNFRIFDLQISNSNTTHRFNLFVNNHTNVEIEYHNVVAGNPVSFTKASNLVINSDTDVYFTGVTTFAWNVYLWGFQY